MERDVFQQTFERLKTQSGLTDAEIARRLDVNRSTVSRWKDGTISPPLSKIKEIANLFGVSPLEFIDDSVEENEVRNTLKKALPEGAIPVKGKSITVPLYGSIAAGVPLEAIPVEEYIEIPEDVGVGILMPFFSA